LQRCGADERIKVKLHSRNCAKGDGSHSNNVLSDGQLANNVCQEIEPTLVVSSGSAMLNEIDLGGRRANNQRAGRYFGAA
jgi:hypothetical protein